MFLSLSIHLMGLQLPLFKYTYHVAVKMSEQYGISVEQSSVTRTGAFTLQKKLYIFLN